MITGLLDTQVLLWVFAGDERVPGWLVEGIGRDPGAFAVSDVSLWEIAIKRATGKLQTPDELPQIVTDFGFAQIAISRTAVWEVRRLPLHHRDPFDRLLIVQARELGAPLVTADRTLSAYDIAVLW